MTDECLIMLDSMFAKVEILSSSGDYLRASSMCDSIKRHIKTLQNRVSSVAGGAGAIMGGVAGIAAPGIGNVTGAIIGASLFHWFFKFIVGRGLYYPNTIEEVIDLASSLRLECVALRVESEHMANGDIPTRALPKVEALKKWDALKKKLF